MTNDPIQDLVTLGLVAIAALYVARRGWLVFHPEGGVNTGSGCGGGGCASCPSSGSNASGPPRQVVTIGPPPSGPGKRI